MSSESTAGSAADPPVAGAGADPSTVGTAGPAADPSTAGTGGSAAALTGGSAAALTGGSAAGSTGGSAGGSAVAGRRARPSVAAVALSLVAVGGILVVDPAGWSPFGPAKWGSEVVGALLALAAVAGAGRWRCARRAAAAWVMFLGWVVVAASVGLDRHLAWWGTPQRHFGALTWLLCAALFVGAQSSRSERDARWIVAAAAGLAGASGLWSVAELAGWNPAGVATGSRLIGPLGNASYLGAAESLLVPIAAGVAADRSWRGAHRLAALGCAALGTVALVGSGTRAAWVGAAVAVALVATVRRVGLAAQWRSARGVARRHPVRAVGAVVIALGALSGVVAATGAAGRVVDLGERGQLGGLSRVAEWETAVRVLAAHPLTGVGPEGYRIAFGQAVSATYQERYGRDPLPDRAHDSLLDVAVTTGVPGLAGYLALLVAAGVFWWRALRRAPPWLAGVAAGIAAYLAGSLFLFPLAEVEPALWLLLGVLAARTASEAEVMTVDLPPPLSLVAVAAAAGCTVVGVRAVAADQDMRAALAASASGAGAGAGVGTAATAPALAARAVALDPGNIVLRLAAAEIDAGEGTTAGVRAALAEVGAALGTSPGDPVLGEERATLLVQRAELTGATADWRQAGAALSALVSGDPRNPAILLPLGVVDTVLGHQAAAEARFTAAARLAPRSPQPDADLALLYQQEGRDVAARQAAERAVRLDPGDLTARRVLDQTSPGGT